ncbi:MAG: hypothetical protein DI628_01885 [Blastochloris viridis]|uniref:DUF5681 domain-containing protein n=1 Tax=Blastochloris viridis TaxID=1079 RepID=A0A6N4R866_BLAVI|nr:MAG: hypothetical protein DI628_01885 [Blastochloris viridis]
MSTKKTGKGHGEGSKATRIKPGEVKNPKGRPIGSRNMATIVREALMRDVEWPEKGELLRIPLVSAFIDACMKQGMKDVRYAQMMMDMIIFMSHHDAQMEYQRQETENYETWKTMINIYRLHDAKLMDLDEKVLDELIATAQKNVAKPMGGVQFMEKLEEKIKKDKEE